jgi:hypothetical protein
MNDGSSPPADSLSAAAMIGDGVARAIGRRRDRFS